MTHPEASHLQVHLDTPTCPPPHLRSGHETPAGLPPGSSWAACCPSPLQYHMAGVRTQHTACMHLPATTAQCASWRAGVHSCTQLPSIHDGGRCMCLAASPKQMFSPSRSQSSHSTCRGSSRGAGSVHARPACVHGTACCTKLLHSVTVAAAMVTPVAEVTSCPTGQPIPTHLPSSSHLPWSPYRPPTPTPSLPAHPPGSRLPWPPAAGGGTPAPWGWPRSSGWARQTA